MHAKQEKFFTPDLTPPPPAPPQVWVLGPDPQWVNFSKTPHMRVQNDQRNEGII